MHFTVEKQDQMAQKKISAVTVMNDCFYMVGQLPVTLK